MGRTRKRRRSWGSITTVTRGKHVLRYMENAPEGRRRRSKTFYGTYREANLELERLHVACDDAGDRPVPTVGQAYDMWYVPWRDRRVAEGRMKPRSVASYDAAWRKHVAPRWADVPVTCVRPLDAQEWLAGLSAGVAQHSKIVLRKVLSFAERYELVASNPLAKDYEMPVAKARERSTEVYTLGRANAAWERVRGSIIEPAFLAACFGSCRTGESGAILASEVTRMEACGLELAVCPVRRQMDDAGDEPIPSLKNPQSVRDAIIPPPYSARVLELAADGRTWLAEWHDGTPMNKRRIRAEWAAAIGDEYIPFANLRNSWRTFAQYEWVVDHDTLELLMGHKLPGVTGQHYLRPTTEQLAQAFASALVQSAST